MTIEEIRTNFNKLTIEQLQTELEDRREKKFYAVMSDAYSDYARQLSREIAIITSFIEIKLKGAE